MHKRSASHLAWASRSVAEDATRNLQGLPAEGVNQEPTQQRSWVDSWEPSAAFKWGCHCTRPWISFLLGQG